MIALSDHRSVRLTAALALSMLATSALAEPRIEKTVKAGSGLYQLVVSPTTKTVYVAAAGSRVSPGAKIIAFDANTLEKKSEIDVTAVPLFGIGLNDKTQKLYGTGTRAGTLSVIDLKTGKVATNIKEGDNAHLREIAIDQATNTIYASVVGNRGAARPDAPKAELWVIDGNTDKFLHAIAEPSQTAVAAAFDSAQKRVYTTDMVKHQVLVVDPASRKVVATWASGGEQPMNVAVDTAKSRLFVSNQGTGTLTVLDSKTGALIKSIPTGGGALAVAFSPKNNQVYVTNRQAGTTSVVDATSLNVIANLPTGSLPQTVVVDETTGLVYVTNKARNAPPGSAPAGRGGAGRGAAPEGGAAPATPPPPPYDDPTGDTLVLIRP